MCDSIPVYKMPTENQEEFINEAYEELKKGISKEIYLFKCPHCEGKGIEGIYQALPFRGIFIEKTHFVNAYKKENLWKATEKEKAKNFPTSKINLIPGQGGYICDRCTEELLKG